LKIVLCHPYTSFHAGARVDFYADESADRFGRMVFHAWQGGWQPDVPLPLTAPHRKLDRAQREEDREREREEDRERARERIQIDVHAMKWERERERMEKDEERRNEEEMESDEATERWIERQYESMKERKREKEKRERDAEREKENGVAIPNRHLNTDHFAIHNQVPLTDSTKKQNCYSPTTSIKSTTSSKCHSTSTSIVSNQPLTLTVSDSLSNVPSDSTHPKTKTFEVPNAMRDSFAKFMAQQND
jgi:hypothetical protein